MALNNFHYALSLLNTMYGIEMDEDDFEEVASVAYRLIGNKKMQIKRYHTCVDECDKGLELPCEIAEKGLIEAVTTDFEDWDYSNNYTPNGNIYSAFTENYIEHRKAFRHPMYAHGKFIHYELVGNKLYFDRPHGHVNILYRTELLDDDGLPQLTDAEAMAIATYVAYITKYKEGLSTNNAALIQLAGTLLLQWQILVDLARTDYYMSLNELNDVLEATLRGFRKQIGSDYKIYT